MAMTSLRSSVFAALVAFTGLGLLASGARASTLDLLGNGSTGTITYAATAAGGLTVSATALSGSSFFSGTLGTYGLTAFGPMTSGPENAQGQFVFSSGNTDTLTVSVGLSSLTATVTWATITDGTLTPRFNGSFVITAISGADFISNFGPVGSFGNIDMTTNVALFLSTLAAGREGSETSTGISSGELVSRVPVPAALPLFASGLAGLWVLGRRRKKQKAEVAIA